MRMTMNCRLIPFVAAVLAWPVQAQSIYKCVDASGNTLISNARMDRNCKAVVTGPDSSVPAPRPKGATGAAANPSPNGFPRVQEDAQKARDNDRKRILEQEMASEQRNLEQAKKELAEQEAVRMGDERNYQRMLDRLQPYKDRVAQHERNIQAIQKELSNLR